MLSGIIGPKGRPGFLHPHRHGVLNLAGERKFLVDDQASQVIDEEGKPLVHTRESYDSIREEIAGGAPMILEPAGDGAEELGEARREIASLRRQLEAANERIAELERAATPVLVATPAEPGPPAEKPKKK